MWIRRRALIGFAAHVPFICMLLVTIVNIGIHIEHFAERYSCRLDPFPKGARDDFQRESPSDHSTLEL